MRALGAFGDPNAFKAMSKSYLAHITDDVYMGELGPEALLALDRKRAIPVLLEAFVVSGHRGRYSCARALHGCPTDEVRRRMEALLNDEEKGPSICSA